jgi:hypothetical protein
MMMKLFASFLFLASFLVSQGTAASLLRGEQEDEGAEVRCSCADCSIVLRKRIEMAGVLLPLL